MSMCIWMEGYYVGVGGRDRIGFFAVASPPALDSGSTKAESLIKGGVLLRIGREGRVREDWWAYTATSTSISHRTSIPFPPTQHNTHIHLASLPPPNPTNMIYTHTNEQRTEGSAWLCDAKEGEEVDMTPALGKGFKMDSFDDGEGE